MVRSHLASLEAKDFWGFEMSSPLIAESVSIVGSQAGCIVVQLIRGSGMMVACQVVCLQNLSVSRGGGELTVPWALASGDLAPWMPAELGASA